MSRTIEQETALIKRLEASGPEIDRSVGLYHSNNSAWHQHATAIKDAYWRRRMLRTKLEGGDLDACARIG